MYQYKPEDVDCKYCAERRHWRCQASGCPWLAERIEAGTVSYAAVILKLFRDIKDKAVVMRLGQLVLNFRGSVWLSAEHEFNTRQLLQSVGFGAWRDPRYFAALYLFGSNRTLLKRAWNACLPQRFIPEYIGSATYESHSFAYGDWQDYSETQHRRSKTCSDCGYSVYEYADHADANGDGLCDGCGKQLTIYVDVTLDACGGVLSEDEVTVIYGNTYGELPEPTREGYIFDGWFTEADGGELVERNTEVGSKTAHTLYAHWTLVKVFSVTVPAGLPLAVTENGEVTASTDAAIANNSTCDVRVTGVTLRTENGWTLVPFTYNMAAAKVDSKLIGFAIGGAQSANSGDSEALTLTGDWSIASGGTLPLDYDAKVSATSVGIDEQVLTVVFVVEEVT